MKALFERKPGGLVYGLSAATVIFGFVALAQQMSNTVVKDFSVPENFDPPHERQLKSLLQGAEAEPQSGGLILIRRLKLQAFTETGETQMVVLAPQCVFDTAQHTVNSAGYLEARSGDGRLFVEGEGFLFQQTNLNLIISNHVHTIILNTPQKSTQTMKTPWLILAAAPVLALNAQTNLPAPEFPAATNAAVANVSTNQPVREPSPVNIFSDFSHFDLKNRVYVYTNHVLVTTPQSRLTCDVLTAEVPQLKEGKYNRVTAERNVVMDFLDDKGQTNHATADKAVYTDSVTNSITNSVVILTGNPVVTNPKVTIRGDPIVWDRVHYTVFAKDQETTIISTGTNAPNFLDGFGPAKTNAPRAKPGGSPK